MKHKSLLMLFAIILCSNSLQAASPSYVQIAAQYIGKGEQGCDNCGPWVKKFLRSDERLPWCAAFVSYVLSESGYKGPYRLSARSFLKAGRIVKKPAGGDLIVFSRGANAGHVGIVERVDSNFVYYIDGNHGKFPAVVSRRKATLGKVPKLLAYVRINR